MNESARDDQKPSGEALQRPKRAPVERVSITRKMVEKAIADARAKRETEILDAQCKGLELRGYKGGSVSWTLRTRLHGYLKRYVIGDHMVAPEEARERGWKVKEFCRQGQNPAGLITQFKTGKSIERQEREKAGASIPWTEARDRFLDEIKRTRRYSTYAGYRNLLNNTPELKVFEKQMVSTITEDDLGDAYVAIHARAEPHSEHVARVVSSMWGFLAKNQKVRKESGVSRARYAAVRETKPPERTLVEGRAKKIRPMQLPPTLEQIGRVVAVARSGAFSPQASAAILLAAATAQRRRTIMSINSLELTDHGPDGIEWNIPPVHRKTGTNPRSQLEHKIPLLGWAADAARELQRATNGIWLFPPGPTDGGKQTIFEHRDPGWLTKIHSWVPGGFSPHRWRKAMSTHGSKYLGWKKGAEKKLLDHMEGTASDDVTDRHYNLDPRMQEKVRMLTDWMAFVDDLAAKAIKDEPWLTDVPLLREKIYRARYREARWKAAVERVRKYGGKAPWDDEVDGDDDAAIAPSLRRNDHF